MARRRRGKDEAVGSSWMTSYTDLVTVLFALFVMLYALSEVDEELWYRFVRAAAHVFGAGQPYPFDFGSPGINDLMGSGMVGLPELPMPVFEPPAYLQNFEGADNQMEIAAEILQTYFGQYGVGDQIVVGGVRDDEGELTGELIITTHGDMYFDSGSADIRPETFPILEVIGSAITFLQDTMEIEIMVVGHTDTDPIATFRFPDNWELSVARATSITRHLVYTLGVIEPDRIGSQGFGEYRPVATNETEEGKQQNRRVEIIIRQR
jgi:chemotaxis protein MotB